jgi:hypothetical protein
MNWPRDSTRRVVLKQSPRRTCEMPGIVMSVGKPQGRFANLKGYIHTSGKKHQYLLGLARSAHRSNTLISPQ